jgi:hypothetical protein
MRMTAFDRHRLEKRMAEQGLGVKQLAALSAIPYETVVSALNGESIGTADAIHIAVALHSELSPLKKEEE